MDIKNEESKSATLSKTELANNEEAILRANGLLVKLYSNLLHNERVKSGIKQIEKLSAPLVEVYHEYVDENLLRVRKLLTELISNKNVYYHLTELWISKSHLSEPSSLDSR